MICKICGADMPNGKKFCSTCGNPMPVEEKVVAPVGFDPDATIIADTAESFNPAERVAPAAQPTPAAPVYQAPPAPPVAPVAPVFQAPPVTPAKKPVDVKLIAIIGGAVALIAAIVILIVCLAGNSSGKKDDEKDSKGGSSSSVASVVKEYTQDYFEDIKFSNYKSELKISADGAYYQIFTASAEEDGEKGFLIASAWVYKNNVDEFEYEFYAEEDKSEFEDYVKEVVETAKKSEPYYKEELAEYAYYDDNEYEEDYDY